MLYVYQNKAIRGLCLLLYTLLKFNELCVKRNKFYQHGYGKIGALIDGSRQQ